MNTPSKHRVFPSSVQREFAAQRAMPVERSANNALFREHFEFPAFERMAAASFSVEENHIGEVNASRICLFLIGKSHGNPAAGQALPTEREFQAAYGNHVESFAFLAGRPEDGAEEAQRPFITRIKELLSCRRFSDRDKLREEVERICFRYLRRKGVILTQGFDSRVSPGADLKAIGSERVNHFLDIARHKRGFPLKSGTALKKVRSHSNISTDCAQKNAAILAFSGNHQAFFPAASVKRAPFHGARVEKPIPDDRMNFARAYLQPALKKGLLEMTLPDKPTSRNQRYRLAIRWKRLKSTLTRNTP
jgi:hypothetical protein